MSFCAAAGGVWPAFQAYVSFLVTNIFAHAATIHLPSGLSSTSTILAIITSIFLPVFAGDRAFHSINRWGARLITGKMGIGDAFGGSTLEDGATSGVVVICVPLRFAPVLCGRWSRVTTDQNTTTLNNAIFWQPAANPHLPFKVDGIFPKYVPFVLPPATRFPGYQNYRISPSSAGLGQIIAVVQIVLSARQLYLNYSTSLLSDGVSSPYVFVIPYILMSTVNLITNTLVGSYTQATVLPMAHDVLPKDNEAFIAGAKVDKYSLRVFALPESLPLTPPTAKNQPFDDLEEFDGDRWIAVPVTQEDPYVTETQIANLGFFRIHRREEWTSVCYDISWGLSFKKNAHHLPTHETDENEAKKKRVVLFKQTLGLELGWRLMKGDISGESGRADLNDLKVWLSENYPGVEIPLDDLPKRFQYWSLVSGVFLQMLVTVTVGAITRFHLHNRVYAAWILLWIYGSAALRWTSIITNSLNQSPCLLLKMWLLFAMGIVLEFFLAIAVLGGITVIVVELFGAMCGLESLSLSAGYWILVGFSITFVSAIAVLVVFYSSTILGNIPSISPLTD